MWKARVGVDCRKQNVGTRQVGKISKKCRGTCDQQVCRNLRSMFRLRAENEKVAETTRESSSKSERRRGTNPGRSSAQFIRDG